MCTFVFFFFSSRRRHTIFSRDWSSDVCSSDLPPTGIPRETSWRYAGLTNVWELNRQKRSDRRPSEIGWKNGKRPALKWRDGAEGALVEGDDSRGRIPRPEHDERRVGKAEPKVSVPFHDRSGGLQFVATQAVDNEGASREILDERQLDIHAEPVEDQIIRLCDRQLRRDERLSLRQQNPRDLVMVRLAGICLGIQRARIDKEGQSSAGPSPCRAPPPESRAHRPDHGPWPCSGMSSARTPAPRSRVERPRG